MLSTTAATAASTPATATAAMITVSALTPSSRAVGKSMDAARICSPIDVRLSISASTPKDTAPAQMATIETQRTCSVPIVTAWLSRASVPIGSPMMPCWRYVY